MDKLGAITYSVAFAEWREIGREWSDIVWDKHHRQIQYHRLYLLTDGEGTLRLYNGELTLTPGNVYLIPAFSILESGVETKMNKYYIHFQADSPVFEMYRYISNKFVSPATDLSESLFRMVVENYAVGSDAGKMRVQGAMNLILSDFLDGIEAAGAATSRFSAVLEYINENYTKPIKLDELSAIMNVSTMYFSNTFKSTFNISPKQYILNKRLTESQRLLLESDMSIKEIAYATGFENESYFSEFFTAKVGISALKFRNRRLPKTHDSIL